MSESSKAGVAPGAQTIAAGAQTAGAQTIAAGAQTIAAPGTNLATEARAGTAHTAHSQAASSADASTTAESGFARRLASPIGVLVTVPALVAAVGIGILLVGRDATRTASGDMARRMLTTHAASVQSDVAFALDQAGPVLERLRALTDPSRSTTETLVRIHDLVVGRPPRRPARASSAAIAWSRGSAPAAWARSGAPSTGCSRAAPRSS